MQNTLSQVLPSGQTPLVAPEYRASALLPTEPAIARATDAFPMEAPGEKGTLVLNPVLTGNRTGVGTCEVAPGAGPPLHVHQDEDEIFLVQSGAVEYQVNGKTVQARAGDVVFAPRGEVHNFRGLDVGEPNRFTIIIAPGGFEKFFARHAELLTRNASMREVVENAAQYGITFFDPSQPLPLVENSRARVVEAGSTPQYDVYGDIVNVWLDAKSTGGAYTLVSVESPKDAGPPPHIHTNEDELFIIQEGEFEFTLGEATHIARAGDVVWGPRGYTHTFRAVSERGAKMWVLITPGGFDGFFHDCGVARAEGKGLSAVLGIGSEYGLSFMMPNSTDGASFDC